MTGTGRVCLGAELEIWRQGEFGTGAAAAASAQLRLGAGLGLVAEAGYKGEGYVLGRALEGSAFGAVGIRYDFDHGPRGR